MPIPICYISPIFIYDCYKMESSPNIHHEFSDKVQVQEVRKTSIQMQTLM